MIPIATKFDSEQNIAEPIDHLEIGAAVFEMTGIDEEQVHEGSCTATPLFSPFSTPAIANHVAPPEHAPHICIVGAGIAGLRCATVLHESGIRVTILEARDRIGGRVC